MKRALPLLALAAGFLVACRESEIQMPLPDGPSLLIVDGAHGGNPAFFFLSPLVPNPSGFGVFDPTALPTIEVCRLDGPTPPPAGPCPVADVEQRVDPSEIDGRSDHYHYGLDMTPLTTRNPNDLELFRITVLIGRTDKTVLAFLGVRDVEASTTICSSDAAAPVLCVSPNTTVQIKFRIDEDAMCFTPGVPFPDPDCAGGTVSQLTGSTTFTTGNGNAGTVGHPLTTGGAYALKFHQVPFNECNLGMGGNRELGLQVGNGFHPMQWAQFPICYQILTTEDNINNLVEELFGYELCFEHEGLMIDEPNQKPLVRIARMSNARDELQVLDLDPGVNAAVCIEETAGLGNKMLNLARGFVNTITGPFTPKPLFAARTAVAVRDAGVTGSGEASVIGAILSARATLNSDGSSSANLVDLGVVADGAPLDARVFASDADFGLVQGNYVTFAPQGGDKFNGSGAPTTLVTSSVDGSAGGTWTVNGAGVHTLSASCFPCSDPPVTGDDALDGFAQFDNLTLPAQTIEFTATVIALSFASVPKNGTVGELFDITVCVGAEVAGLDVTLTAINNNGTPNDIRDSYDNSNPTFTTETDADDVDPSEVLVDENGCFTAQVKILKEGAIRIVASSGDLSVTSSKINIRPAK